MSVFNADLDCEYFFIFCQFELRKNMFVDVSFIIKSDKAFIFN
jgi:hypothetical protein